jgi:hypothetical protein
VAAKEAGRAKKKIKRLIKLNAQTKNVREMTLQSLSL